MSNGKIENPKMMRDELAVLFENVKNGRVKAFDAKEMTNMTGKMINSIKMEMEYAVLKEKITGLKIDFMEY